MRAKANLFFLALMFLFVSGAFGNQLNQARSLFYQGNAYYSKEEFEQAIAVYEGALTLGIESGPLYYNLGNVYFKHGSLGKAILNYLRAQRLMPRDADLTSNLDYAQSLIKGGRVVPQGNRFARMFFNQAGSFSLNGLTLISVVLYFALAILTILIIVTKRLRKALAYIAYPILVALIIFGSLFLAQFYQTVIQKQAVVIAETSDSKFEPLDGATTYFTLYEGESIVVVGSKEDWVKLRRRDGRQGWVKQPDIELL